MVNYNKAKLGAIKMSLALASNKTNESEVYGNMYGDMEPTLRKPKFKIQRTFEK